MTTAIDYSNWKEEVINGKTYYMSPSASPRHNEIMLNLSAIFKHYLRGKKCSVYQDITVHLDEDNKVEPDISIICDKSKITPNGYHGVPSLIVEILSTNRDDDKKLKYDLYERVGVLEYWIIDPISQALDQYVLIDGR